MGLKYIQRSNGSDYFESKSLNGLLANVDSGRPKLILVNDTWRPMFPAVKYKIERKTQGSHVIGCLLFFSFIKLVFF